MQPVVVLNPGSREGDDRASTVEQLLLETFPDGKVWHTKEQGDARKLAAKAAREGFDPVVSAGGDGTLNEVVNGLMDADTDARLGIIPLGTGNDFARSLDIIPGDAERAMETLRHGVPRSCDVLCYDQQGDCRYFVNLASGGATAHVDETLTSDIKQMWGPFAYFRAAVPTLLDLPVFRVVAVLDGADRIEVEAVNIMVANGSHVAAGIPIAPEARVDDGLLDVIMLTSEELPDVASTAINIFQGTHLDPGQDQNVIFRQATSVEFSVDPPMSFRLDGEPLEETTSCLVTIRPGALRIISPIVASVAE